MVFSFLFCLVVVGFAVAFVGFMVIAAVLLKSERLIYLVRRLLVYVPWKFRWPGSTDDPRLDPGLPPPPDPPRDDNVTS